MIRWVAARLGGEACDGHAQRAPRRPNSGRLPALSGTDRGSRRFDRTASHQYPCPIPNLAHPSTAGNAIPCTMPPVCAWGTPARGRLLPWRPVRRGYGPSPQQANVSWGLASGCALAVMPASNRGPARHAASAGYMRIS